MKTKYFIFVFSLLMVGTGCGGTGTGTASAYSDGRCTQLFIDDYNRVYRLAKATEGLSADSVFFDLRADVKRSCDTFNADNVGDISCRAVSTSTGNRIQLVSSDIKTKCASNDSAITTAQLKAKPVGEKDTFVADSQGYCRQRFLSQYKSVMLALDAAADKNLPSHDMSQKSAKFECDLLAQMYPEETHCKAVFTKNGQDIEQTISPPDAARACEKLQKKD